MSQKRYSLYPVDWLIIGYCGLMILLILALGRPINQYADELLFYAGMATAAALIIRFVPEQGHWAQRLLRIAYPALMFTFFYRATGGVMFLVFDRFFDGHLTGMEQAILGFEPSLYIDKHALHVSLNELFMGCYFAYYFMLPGYLVPTFILKRNGEMRRALAAISLTFFVSYMLFFLYPIEGPRWHFQGQYLHTIDGPFFRQLVNFMIAKGAVRGGCMPSTHVAVALVILLFVFRQSKMWGWIMLPVVLGLAVGTVWGRYHYISDVVVGALIGATATWVVLKYHHRFEPASAGNGVHVQRKVKYVA